jgi:hypothetical protein
VGEKPARPIGEVSEEFLPSQEGNAASRKELMSIVGMSALQVMITWTSSNSWRR